MKTSHFSPAVTLLAVLLVAALGTQSAVADIGYDLGFSSQASFSRFFISNGVVPPSAYRRCVQSVELQ